MTDPRPEAWLTAPVEGVPALLQPVAHALLQTAGDMEHALRDFPGDLLWTRPAGVASVGFHLLHMRGVVDRLFTYARGEQLTAAQRDDLQAEGSAAPLAVADLVTAFRVQVQRALDQLRATDEQTLLDRREVGRQRLPSTVQGLLFHAAEHVQRHLGQMLVTARLQHKGLNPDG